MAAEALEQSVLESKDKDQLLAIAKALGLKANSRTKKAEIIDSILEMTGSSAPVPAATNGDAAPVVDEQPGSEGLNGTAISNGAGAGTAATRPVVVPQTAVVDADAGATTDSGPVLGEDGEPLAEWELTLGAVGETDVLAAPSPPGDAPVAPTVETSTDAAAGPAPSGQPQTSVPADGESRNRRRRRRRKGNRGPDGPQGDDAGLVEADLESQPVGQRVRRSVRIHRHARRGLRLLAGEGLPPESGGLLHPGQARPPVRPAQGRSHHRHEPSSRPQREESGAPRRADGQRRRP